jgi:hypothetical protein
MTDPSNDRDEKPQDPERPLFPHPEWMVGIVLIIAVLAILAGIANPIWFLLGLPFIIVLVLFLYVRLVKQKDPKE